MTFSFHSHLKMGSWMSAPNRRFFRFEWAIPSLWARLWSILHRLTLRVFFRTSLPDNISWFVLRVESCNYKLNEFVIGSCLKSYFEETVLSSDFLIKNDCFFLSLMPTNSTLTWNSTGLFAWGKLILLKDFKNIQFRTFKYLLCHHFDISSCSLATLQQIGCRHPTPRRQSSWSAKISCYGSKKRRKFFNL